MGSRPKDSNYKRNSCVIRMQGDGYIGFDTLISLRMLGNYNISLPECNKKLCRDFHFRLLTLELDFETIYYYRVCGGRLSCDEDDGTEDAVTPKREVGKPIYFCFTFHIPEKTN